MLQSTTIRMLLAAVLALWSPAWSCCCASILGRGCGEFGLVVAAPLDAGAELGQCGDRPEAAAKSCCQSSSDERSSPAPDAPQCGCGDHLRQFDLSRNLALPVLDVAISFGPAPVAIEPSPLETLAVVRARALARAPDASAGIPRADSLLARHCLLTI